MRTRIRRPDPVEDHCQALYDLQILWAGEVACCRLDGSLPYTIGGSLIFGDSTGASDIRTEPAQQARLRITLCAFQELLRYRDDQASTHGQLSSNVMSSPLPTTFQNFRDSFIERYRNLHEWRISTYLSCRMLPLILGFDDTIPMTIIPIDPTS